MELDLQSFFRLLYTAVTVCWYPAILPPTHLGLYTRTLSRVVDPDPHGSALIWLPILGNPRLFVFLHWFPKFSVCGQLFYFYFTFHCEGSKICGHFCESGIFFTSQIRIFTSPDPGSKIFRIRIKNLSISNPKNCFFALGNMIRDVHPGSGSTTTNVGWGLFIPSLVPFFYFFRYWCTVDDTNISIFSYFFCLMYMYLVLTNF